MKPETVLEKINRRKLAFSLGLFLLAVYLLTYRGGFHSVDEVSIFAVTESLVKFARFDTDQIAWTQWTTSQAEAQGFFGQDGHVYSKKGLALSLAQAPLYWLALYLPGLGMLQTVSLLNALVTAATGLLIFMFVQRLGFSRRTAIAVALIFGLATIAFVYAKYLFSEPLAGFLLLLAAYMLFVYRQEGGWRHVAIAGLAAGFAVLTRANNLFLLPVFGLYLLWIATRRRRGEETNTSLPSHRLTLSLIPPLAVFVITVGFTGAILMAYNAFRSGNPLQTGYDLTLFSPNILLGLYKLLFSPLRGFFIYSPLLILSLPGWWLLRKSYLAEAWLLAGLTGVTIGLFSAWSSGEGLSWGSRFLVPVVPFFAICLAPIVENATSSRVTGGKVAKESYPTSRLKSNALRFTF
jgi:4-amino-4-deoxy-L-arabinose transferase-like glycosyltransferase